MNLSTQFYTLLAMCLMGIIFGATLDVYQRFLHRTTRKRLIVFINDILFWVIQACLIFYVLFIVNHGELRFYLVLALICGFSAYQALMKNTFLKILELLINFIKAVARIIKTVFIIIVYRPIKGIILMMVGLVLFIFRVLTALVKAIGKALLWMLKFILYPLMLIGKGILYLLPKRVKKTVVKFFKVLAGYLQQIKKYILKVKQAIYRMIRR